MSVAYKSSSRPQFVKFIDDKLSEHIDKFFIRGLLWYFGWPLFFFVLLAPGWLVSIPPVASCDDGVKKPIAPGRATTSNVLLHACLFTLLVGVMFVLGAKMGIDFPFHFSTVSRVL